MIDKIIQLGKYNYFQRKVLMIESIYKNYYLANLNSLVETCISYYRSYVQNNGSYPKKVTISKKLYDFLMDDKGYIDFMFDRSREIDLDDITKLSYCLVNLTVNINWYTIKDIPK